VHKKYYNEDFNEYIAHPKMNEEKMDMMEDMGMDMEECIPVGINKTFMPTDKFDSSNLKKTEYNIRERFGHLQEEDDY